MAISNGKPDWKTWVIFAGTFTFCHLAVCAFIVFHNGIDGENLFGFVVFIFSGLLASLEFLVGYAVVDVVVSIGRTWPSNIQRLSAAFGGAVAYALVWIVF